MNLLFYFNILGYPQLTRRRNADVAPFSDNAITRIVRLTIETNVLTSRCALVLVASTINRHAFSHKRGHSVAYGLYIFCA